MVVLFTMYPSIEKRNVTIWMKKAISVQFSHSLHRGENLLSLSNLSSKFMTKICSKFWILITTYFIAFIRLPQWILYLFQHKVQNDSSKSNYSECKQKVILWSLKVVLKNMSYTYVAFRPLMLINIINAKEYMSY